MGELRHGSQLSLRVNEQESRKGRTQNNSLFVTSSWSNILSLLLYSVGKSKSLGPGCMQKEKITKGQEHQKTKIIKDDLRDCQTQ